MPPVLVVDDEKNMRLTLETVLRHEDDVLLADSAEAALKRLADDEVFLVISDARLGGMSGYEFLREIVKLHSKVPVLIITAYATPKLAVEAIKNGAVDYLAKSPLSRGNCCMPSPAAPNGTGSSPERRPAGPGG